MKFIPITLVVCVVVVVAVSSRSNECPTATAPLVESTGLLAKNFKKTCNELKRADEFVQLNLHLQSCFANLSFVDAVKISVGPEQCLDDKIFELFRCAIDQTYPNSPSANKVFKKYFKDLFDIVGLTSTFNFVYTSSKGMNGKFASVMKKACSDAGGSKDDCDVFVKFLICFETSLVPQTVFKDVLEKVGASDIACFANEDPPLKTPMEVMAENLKQKCSKKKGFDKLFKLINNIAIGYNTLTDENVVDIVGNIEDTLKSKINSMIKKAIDLTYATDGFENKLFTKFYDNVYDNVGLSEYFLLQFGAQINSIRILQYQMEKTCEKFPKQKDQCDKIIALIGCFEQSIPSQKFLTELLIAAGFEKLLPLKEGE